MYQDYWHHWEDVVTGYLLGITVAYCFYRSLYPPLTSSRSDVPTSEYHARHHVERSKAYGADSSYQVEKRQSRSDAPPNYRMRGEPAEREITEATPLMMSTNV